MTDGGDPTAGGAGSVSGAPARLVVVCLLTATAAVAFAPLFGGAAHLPVVLGAAAVPFAVAALSLLWPRTSGARLRRDTTVGPTRLPPALRVLLGLLGAAVVAVAGAHPGAELIDGPLRLLTGALPVDATGPELAAVALAVGLAATAGAELALVARRPPTAAVPAVLCLVLALALGASVRPPPALVPVALVGGLGALLAVCAVAGARNRRRPRLAGAGRSGPGTAIIRLAGATVVVVAAAALAWTFGRDVPGANARGSRFDARDLVAEQVLPKTALSPLAAFADLRATRSQMLFAVSADRPVERLRVATLPRFDGHLWSAAGPHLRAGRALPPPAVSEGDASQARLDVQVTDPERATWLPTLGASGRAVEISVAGLGVDPATGDLVVPTDRVVPDSYRVVSQEPDLTVEQLRGAVAAEPSGRPVRQVSALERTYLPAIRDVVDRASTPFGKVAALGTYFSRTGGFSRDDGERAASGHGLAQIERLLRTRRGTSEQYASTFAVLARSLGYDTRVAVGFKLDSPVPAGEVAEITGAAAHAWPEVRFRQLGWVPFEPTPTVVRPRGRPGTAAPSAIDRVEEAVDQEVTGQPRRNGDDRRAVPAPAAPGRVPTSAGVVALAAGAALAGVAVLAAAIPPLAKAVRRRRRRRAAAPSTRVTGAWDDTVDRLVEHRVPVSVSMTSGEVIAAATERLGRNRTRGLGTLATIADTASFAADGVDEGQDVAAWELCDRLRRTLVTGVAPHRRIGCAVDPRPLGRRGRRRRHPSRPAPVSAGGRQAR